MLLKQKKFDLHISVSHDNVEYIASCIFGKNALLMSKKGGDISGAIFALINDLSLNATFDLLLQNPLMSIWPVPHSPSHTHTHQISSPRKFGTTSASSNSTMNMFDLHIECGYEVDQNNMPKSTYAFTQIDNGQCHKFAGTAAIFEHSIENLLVDLTIHKMFDQLQLDPSFSTFPFNNQTPSSSPSAHRSTNDVARPAEIAKKDLPRNLPSALIGEPYPQCQDTCTSWDIFGKVKCKNMCEWRKEV